jgi:hypothetical protein
LPEPPRTWRSASVSSLLVSMSLTFIFYSPVMRGYVFEFELLLGYPCCESRANHGRDPLQVA